MRPAGTRRHANLGILLAVGLPLACGPVRAAQLPEGFAETRVAAGFTGATAMEVAPDGRAFVCEQTGALRVVKDDVLLPRPFVTVPVDSSWERGLLGVAFDPRFADNHFVYLCYTPPAPYPHHRVSRFTADGDVAVPGSELILLEGDNQELLGGGVKNGHQGGAVHFGRDGKLYVAIGDQTAGAPAQDLKTFQGKILRINPDGSIPEDNPFYHQTTGKYRAIWALGLRNPFTFAVQPGTGRMFINDVGGAHEEINEGVAGANYGWPTVNHGPTKDPRFRGPVHWYKESSITGGTFYNPPANQFPPEYLGKYFFNDYKAGWVKVLDPEPPYRVRDFAQGFGTRGVVDLKVAADGSLYYLSRNAWVKDQDFRPNTGALYRIRYVGRPAPPVVAAQPVPQTVPAGGAAFFRVAAYGSGPLRYQWQRDGRDLPGATAATYVIRSAAAADDGAAFRCVVINDHGRVSSEPAALRVEPSDQEAVARAYGGLFVRPPPGAYTGPVRVRLSYTPGAAVLRYTTDGSAPTDRSTEYTSPLSLERTTTLRVQAFQGGTPQGRPVALTFTLAGATPYGLADREPASVRMPPLPEGAPALLSLTGVFASLADLRPRPGVIPYDVIAPLWSDGASKRRWITPAPGGRIDFAADGEWTFPAGTVFVKHFELATDEARPEVRRRLETRLLVVDGTGQGYGVTYKWRADGSDADLLTDSLLEDVPVRTAAGTRTQAWYYPGRADCLACHTAAAKFVLGVKTRQLNRDFTYPETGVSDNQLRTWNYLGLFRTPLGEGQIPSYRRLVAVEDRRASLEERARSYLDANCAHCHRPGNTVRAAFDARFDTPRAGQNVIGAATVSDSLGLRDPCVVAPGDAGRSMLLHRMTRGDNFRMPPLASSVPDHEALAVLREWIDRLPRPAR
jgi:uncharacterized repeat protein (TIGR03806 family)